MIYWCANSPVVAIISSCSSSSYFAAATTTHHFPIMLLPGRHDTITNLTWRLPRQWLWCQQWCSSSPRQKGITNRLVQNSMYSYVGHNPQPTHMVCWCVVTSMADCGRHGASGEKVSISVGYALLLRTDQTPPIRASKRTPREKSKIKWVPEKVNLGRWARDNDQKGNPKRDQEWGCDGPYVHLTKIGRDQTMKTTKKLPTGTR